MYVRSSHRPLDPNDVIAAMERNRFATLVSHHGGELIASHLPFVYEPVGSDHGTLFAHMARANPHAAALASGSESMVIFSGPHAYISPSWYIDRETAPTWDYVAVHAWGRPELHDAAAARRNIERLIAVVERGDAPWSIDELSPEDVVRMIGNIVSFEIRVTRLEGKFKLNQGETTERNLVVLERLETAGQSELASLMRRYNRL